MVLCLMHDPSFLSLQSTRYWTVSRRRLATDKPAGFGGERRLRG
jgi:hypothetical protein